ncbi:MAG: hypothetical protein NVS2B4_08090 [Ramlibacter sp.]
MNMRWTWLARYAIVVVVALVLGAALGSMDLFKATRLAGKGLTASSLARFLGFGGALVVLWLAAYRATPMVREHGVRWRLVEVTLLPLATLIVIASGYSVLLLVVGSLMDATLRQIYNWVFIGTILGSAAWLLYALFQESTTAPGPGAPSRQPEQADPHPT